MEISARMIRKSKKWLFRCFKPFSCKDKVIEYEIQNVTPQVLPQESKLSSTTGNVNSAPSASGTHKEDREIQNVTPQVLPQESKLSSTTGNVNSAPSASGTHKEDKEVFVYEMPTPATSSRGLSMPNVGSSCSLGDSGSMIHMKPKLTLTRPKEPEFETALRARSVRVKSTVELEEEMMAKMPKFRARPLNRKILQAPTLPVIPRNTPQPPVFKEFLLETVVRANQKANSTSMASTKLSHQEPHLMGPKTPVLQTTLRARPSKLSLNFEPAHKNPILRNTTPIPFHLHTEERGAEKEKKLFTELLQKQLEEEKARIPKANLYPYSTDYPVVPSKPEPKPCTKPKPFQLKSLERGAEKEKKLFTELLQKQLEEEKARIPKANLYPCSTDYPMIPPKPKPKPCTKPKPFQLKSLERGAENEKKLSKELLQKQLEEGKARIPKANLYPYSTDYPVIPPKPKPKPCTKPKPFQMESQVRHEKEMKREMEERKRKDREEAQMRIFKAQPILKEDPMPVPKKVHKPLTQVNEFNLRVDDRAMDRAQFNQKIREKEMMYKRYLEEKEAAIMIEEEKARKQLRQTMVPYARPVPNFDHPFFPQKSAKEATKPKSPNLCAIHIKER